MNVINKLPSQGVIANGVKQSHEIATLARQNASARRHVAMLLAMTMSLLLLAYAMLYAA